MTIRPLSPELAEKAKKELHENPKQLLQDLQHMKDWIVKQPHLRARTGKNVTLLYLKLDFS